LIKKSESTTSFSISERPCLLYIIVQSYKGASIKLYDSFQVLKLNLGKSLATELFEIIFTIELLVIICGNMKTIMNFWSELQSVEELFSKRS
jgi:hypothetical protein